MISNRFVFGNGRSVPYSYMISIAELIQEEGYLVRHIYSGDSKIKWGIGFTGIDYDKEQIILDQLSDNTIVMYIDENIDITIACNMFKEIRDKVGM